MLKHADIWRAIDRLAAKYGLSPSGLARRAGLDPTTFNKSKRITGQNKRRWPSTESLAKILDATGATLAEFLALVGEEDAAALSWRLPALGFAEAAEKGRFTAAGHPTGDDWSAILFPELGDANAFALKLSGDAWEPVYRDGDTIVASPMAELRRGDRLVVKTKAGTLLIRQLLEQSGGKLELTAVGRSTGESTLDASEVDWMARVVWASQ